MYLTVKEIAGITDGILHGSPDIVITALRSAETAGEGDITFISNEKYLKYLENSRVSCVIMREKADLPAFNDRAYIFADDPYKSFVMLLKYLDSIKPKRAPDIHPTAIIAETAKISKSVFIGAFCTIGDNSVIDSGVELHPGVRIAENCHIGSNSIIYPNAVVYADCIIGRACIIHSGAVIGSDGFGNLENSDGSYEKIPQIGNVIIGDNVEIGANTTIDCALFGSTIIEDGVKLDNLIHIGHNCRIGENTAMAAHVGISGSVRIGKRNRIGGQAGLAGHLETADDVVLLAKSGVAKSIEKKGVYFGSPIKDRLKAFKIEAVINNLPDLAKDIAEIKRNLGIE